MRWLKVFAIAGAVLSAGCDPVVVPERQPGEVFDFRLLSGNDSLVLRWPNGSRIRVFQQQIASDSMNSLLAKGFQRAVREWEGASLFGDFRFESVNMPEEADVLLTWGGQELPVDVSVCPPGGASAFTTFCLTQAGDRLATYPLRNGAPSSIRFIVTVRLTEAVSEQRIRALVSHEFGHVLGLAQHSLNSTDLMFRDPVLRDAPNVRDRASLQILYQTRPDIVP